MKVKTLIGFYDRKEKVARKKGNEFTTTAERVAEINATRFGKLVEEVPAKKETKTTAKTIAKEK